MDMDLLLYTDRYFPEIVFMGTWKRKYGLQSSSYVCFCMYILQWSSLFRRMVLDGMYCSFSLHGCRYLDTVFPYPWSVGFPFCSPLLYCLDVFFRGQLGWNLLFSAIVCGFLLWGYRRWLKAFGSQSLFLSVYLFILLCMAFTAASIPFTRQSAGVWMLLAGALCFVASDLILGASIITGKKSEWKDKAVMLLYEPAVFLLTLSVFYQ